MSQAFTKLLLVFVAIFSSDLTAQTNLSQGLIVNLPFTGNTKDSSGNNLHGTGNNVVLTSDRCDNKNSAYNFNGVDAYVQIPVNGLLNTYYSYSIWAFPNEIPGQGKYTYPFSIGGSGGGQNISICNNALQGWSGGAYNNGSTTLSLVSVGSLPTLGEWNHIVLVRDTNKIKLYVNGVLNTNESSYGGWNTSNGGHTPNYGSNPLAIIGGRNLDTGFFFNGIIDDVKIYNRVVTPEEVNALYREKSCFFTNIQAIESLESINVYPNPASTQIHLNIINSGDLKAYKMINHLGQTILSNAILTDEKNISIQLPVLPTGIYTIMIETNSGFIQKQVAIAN